jgi:hypothetical protein
MYIQVQHTLQVLASPNSACAHYCIQSLQLSLVSVPQVDCPVLHLVHLRCPSFTCSLTLQLPSAYCL